MAWKGQASNAGTIVSSASLVIIAAVELSFALLVLLCSVISFFTSRFIPISGLYDRLSCLLYHLKGGSGTEEEVLPFRTCGDPDFDSGEANDLHYGSSCAQVDKILPAVRLKGNSLEESGKTGAHQDRRELANAAEGEAADGDGDQWQAKQTFDKIKEPELEELLLAERKALTAMYLELEKERNASATAANEAMAMIARLQEEKAALLMEARQFRRMVEEKSMHDQEAIESLQKVLANSEEEKSALEEEIKFYRLKLLREQMEESIGARSNENTLILLSGTFAEGRSPEKSISATSVMKGKTAASARAANARVADGDQFRLTGRTNEPKYQIRSPILRDLSHELGTLRVEGSNILPAKTMDRKVITSAPEVARVRSGDKSTMAALVGLEPSKIGRSTSLLNEIGTTKKQHFDTLVVKPENGNEEEFMSLKRRLSSPRPSDVASGSLDEGQEASEELSDRALEERRLSVLEYVWKLEEECHEKAGKQPAQVEKSKSVQVPRSKTQSPVEGTTTLETATKAETMVSVMTEDDPLWQRHPERKTNARNMDVSLFVGGYGSVTPDRHSQADEDESKDRQEAGMSMVIGDETAGQCSNEVLFEHDVYEVQESSDELQRIAGELNRLCHQSDSYRLGKPDLLHSEDDFRSNRNGMEYVRDDFTVPLCEAANFGINTPWEELNWRAWKGDVSTPSKTRRHHFSTSVEHEVQQLTLRLNVLEADRHLLKQTVDSLRENGELKLLQEIAEHLRELRSMQWKGLQQQDSLSDALSSQLVRR